MADTADHHLRSASAAQTEALGERLGALLRPGDVVGLAGDLGAGKTCLVRGVARGAAVADDVIVSSPTFTLVNEYLGRVLIWHADLYRLASPEDLVEVGLIDAIGGDAACVVEWYDRFPAVWPTDHLALHLRIIGDSEREITLAASGARHQQLLAELQAAHP